MRNSPRQISPLRTFEHLVDEMVDLFAEHNCHGAIMGLSGTDSILAYMICEKAFRSLGMPSHITGIYYGNEDDVFAKKDMAWLRERSHGTLIVNDEVGGGRRDGARWGDLIDRAVMTPLWSYRPAKERLWVIGTRNLTEEVLGRYSNGSMLASVQPLIHLWKSEVLDICNAVGVPKHIISRSYIADCGCGDPDMDLLVMNPRLTDLLLMQRTNNLSRSYVPRYDPGMIEAVDGAISRQIIAGAFKADLPHKPSPQAVMCRPEEVA